MVDSSNGNSALDPRSSDTARELILQAAIGLVVDLSIDDISGHIFPRVGGEDPSHTRLLAEIGDTLPPILVHRPTMRIIDGMHRVKAALAKGEKTVKAQYFTGSDEDAFLLSLRLNASHGLPLTLVDRKAAGSRILVMHPGWSDRRVGQICGLDHKTIGRLRRGSTGEVPQFSTGEVPQLEAREGLDGRLRRTKSERRGGQPPLPDSIIDRRLTAGHADQICPDHRNVDVECQGRDETAAAGLKSEKTPPPAASQRSSRNRVKFDRESSLKRLRTDPSLRFSETGRALIRWLEAGPRTPEESLFLADTVPSHCLDVLTSMAEQNLEIWRQMFVRLNQRKRASRPCDDPSLKVGS